jgi:hypothetical protein
MMAVMPRLVAAETLDHLSEQDPAAVRSRQDLQRVHQLMGTRGIVSRALRSMTSLRGSDGPLRALELGAGDGSLMLRVARQLDDSFPPVQLSLMDRQPLVSASTLAAYRDAGWVATTCVMDVLQWAHANEDRGAEKHTSPAWDLIVANLFMHHFEGPQLALLLQAIAAHSRCFLACEPRRSRLALAGSHLIGAIGANAVTREDAVLSVHAGFRGTDLATMWAALPADVGQWALREYAAGLFSHCFVAERRYEPPVARA